MPAPVRSLEALALHCHAAPAPVKAVSVQHQGHPFRVLTYARKLQALMPNEPGVAQLVKQLQR